MNILRAVKMMMNNYFYMEMDACEDFRHSLRLGLYDDFITEAINSPEYYEINRNICVKQHFKNHVNKN